MKKGAVERSETASSTTTDTDSVCDGGYAGRGETAWDEAGRFGHGGDGQGVIGISCESEPGRELFRPAVRQRRLGSHTHSTSIGPLTMAKQDPHNT